MKNRLAPFSFTLGLCMFAAQAMAAGPTGNVYQVQEKWELQLDTPNLEKNTPQYCTHFKIDEDTFILTCFNYQDQPSHVPGGIQVQLWDEGNLVEKVDVTLASLNVTGDTVTWTHKYKLNPDQGTLETFIVGVGSQAWGQINNIDGIVQDPTNIAKFNDYNPADSVVECHINYGSNAVVWFGMTECTTYDDKGKKLSTDSTSRTVFAR